MKPNLQSLLLAVALSATPTFAGTTVVGVATAIGSFSVNQTSVTGTANLTDGTVLTTTDAASQVMLKGGYGAFFATHSAAAIYSDKFVLQHGAARFDNLKPGFKLEASSLRIENDKDGGQGAVGLKDGKVVVASVIGNMNVYSQQGALLARVAAGTAVAFDDPQQSGATSDQPPTNSQTGKPCKSKKEPGCGAYVPPSSGAAAAGAIMSTGAALLVVGGVAAVGLGVGLGVAESGGSSAPVSP